MSSADGAKGLCPLDSRPSSGHAKGALPPLWTPEMLRISHIACGRDVGFTFQRSLQPLDRDRGFLSGLLYYKYTIPGKKLQSVILVFFNPLSV